MMSKMGCHRRLGYARLLNRSGFGFVTVFVIHVRQSLSSLQLPEPERGFFRLLSFSSATSELPQQELLCRTHKSIKEHLFSHLLHAVSVIPLRSISSTASATHTWPLVSLHTIHSTSTVQPTVSFFRPTQHQQKHVPNPRAYCIGRQLFSSCPFLSSTLAQLAVGSRRSSRTSFHLLHSFQITFSYSPCCRAPRGSAQGCFTLEN